MHILSRYLKNGAPKHCQFAPCGKPFNGSCVHGEDGRYYCDESCAEEAEDHGLRRVERIARTVI